VGREAWSAMFMIFGLVDGGFLMTTSGVPADSSPEASLAAPTIASPVPGTAALERGPAGWVLVNLASRPDDVLVVGAGRRGALGRLAFSKVSRYCLAHAQCPVVAIPPPALAGELGHGRLARAFWRRSLTPEQVLRDYDRPAA
jgi:universal stress protein family protein